MSQPDQLTRPHRMTTNHLRSTIRSIEPDQTTRPSWLTDNAWPYPLQTIDVTGCAVSFTDVGTGPTLLFVHVGMWSIVWRDVIEALCDRYRCVTFDAPGSGLSERPQGRLTLAHAVDAIDTLVRTLDLVDVTLVVHDLGTIAALDAANRWTERVAGLVVINGFGWKPTGPMFRSMLAIMGNSITREIDAFTGWMSYASATRFGVARHWDHATRSTYRHGFKRRQRRSFHRYMAAARRHDYTPIDNTIKQLETRPVLTIFGQRNDPLRLQPKWKARFANATQTVVPKGYHFPMCDNPKLIADTITQWHTRSVTTLGGTETHTEQRRI